MVALKEFYGPNAGYVIELYEAYLRDPSSVSPELRELFRGWKPEAETAVAPKVAAAPAVPERALMLLSLVESIRDRGHLAATIDPLGLRARDEAPIRPETHGLAESDLEGLPASSIASPLAEGAASAAEAISRLRKVYSGTVGYEFGHIRDVQERDWLRHAVESGQYQVRLDPTASRELLLRLSQVEAFEQFLHRTFPGQRWFSIEGNDMLLPLLDELVRQAARAGITAMTMGMAHRGRLNVLTHIFHKPYLVVLAEFGDGYRVHRIGNDGLECGWMRDVKYHMGARTRAPSIAPDGQLELVLMYNPSHLELVDPVAIGAARAVQDGRASLERPAPDHDAAMAVLLHGDAAFPGQGIVAETLNMAQLDGYSTGGTIHIIVNNQIGFTTTPQEAHSTPYPTDVARGYDVPVVHVNADDVEACLAVARLAMAYRQRFHKDFVIDLVGYRRYGHNEADEPAFTQPLMYEAIGKHPSVRALWAQRLVAEGVLSPEEAEDMVKNVVARLQEARASMPTIVERQEELPGPRDDHEDAQALSTAVPVELLARLNRELHTLPQGFKLHPRLERPFARRREAADPDTRVDWAHAEALAFASILADGTAIRLTGQDTERGTFSQRHAVLHDASTGQRFIPLQALPSARAPFWVYNSPISEAGALGYEYGYTLGAPDTLTLWEAQFGDFVNNAQSVVDEFLVSGYAKWGQRSGLVLLLPHGYEGQGPDHSNAHLERFLQLAADDNLRVAYCTTSAQYFHLLRRQAALLRSDRRPLVVMTAKSLLRHPLAASALRELAEGGFQPVLDDPMAGARPEAVRRVVLCSGKVYADLVGSDHHAGVEQVAIVRVEELYPFPARLLSSVLARYPHAEEVAWLQEEPRNRGAWAFVAPRLRSLLRPSVTLSYIGRPALPSPAVGSLAVHRQEQQRIIESAFTRVRTPATAQGV